MPLPLFYTDVYQPGAAELVLDEVNSKHVVQVLRMRNGDALELTDGKGHLLRARITDDHKKHCTVAIENASYQAPPSRQLTIAIALLKNANRFEWFLEKATEIGITRILPLKTERTEKQHFRFDRMQGILVSAMLQSRQYWLPELAEPAGLSSLPKPEPDALYLVAHCEPGEKSPLNQVKDVSAKNVFVLIGPEGDFTPREIEWALAEGYHPVSLGENRLRTETAGIVAATLIR